MPQHTRSFDRMIIPAPCDADWDSMTGNDQVRFCEHCSLHVNDLSSMTRRDAMQLVARSQGRVCVRFIHAPNGRVVTRAMPEKLYRIRRRVSRVAATAFTATIGVSSAIAQNRPSSTAGDLKEVVLSVESEPERRTVIDEFTAKVRGIIKTDEGASISNATVVLVDRETGEERTVNSSGMGNYAFEFLPEGEYLLWARKPGFTTETEKVSVLANTAMQVDIQLTERMVKYVVMGAMDVAMVSEDSLIKAISENDAEKVRNLAAADPLLNLAARRHGMSVLTQAVEGGNREIVQTLLALGADVNLRNGNGYTPLMYLSEKTTPELLRDLLSVGARLNARDDTGANPLMIAAASSSVKVLRDLIEAGAQIDARDSSGENSLFRAARNNSPEAIVLLLEAGVDLNVTNEDGDTALMSMASFGKFENFRTLIDRGARRDLLNEDRRTILMLAALNEDAQLAQLLVESGANIAARDRAGNTALMLAAEAGHVDTVLLLASNGGNLDEQDDDGETALIKAVKRNSVECVQALLRAGADITSKNKEGETALTIARQHKNSEILKLFESGAPR